MDQRTNSDPKDPRCFRSWGLHPHYVIMSLLYPMTSLLHHYYVIRDPIPQFLRGEAVLLIHNCNTRQMLYVSYLMSVYFRLSPLCFLLPVFSVKWRFSSADIGPALYVHCPQWCYNKNFVLQQLSFVPTECSGQHKSISLWISSQCDFIWQELGLLHEATEFVEYFSIMPMMTSFHFWFFQADSWAIDLSCGC